MHRRLQIAGTILILGLIIEALSLCLTGTFAFLVFVAVAGLLLLAGITAYLLALVHTAGDKSSATDDQD